MSIPNSLNFKMKHTNKPKNKFEDQMFPNATQCQDIPNWYFHAEEWHIKPPFSIVKLLCFCRIRKLCMWSKYIAILRRTVERSDFQMNCPTLQIQFPETHSTTTPTYCPSLLLDTCPQLQRTSAQVQVTPVGRTDADHTSLKKTPKDMLATRITAPNLESRRDSLLDQRAG